MGSASRRVLVVDDEQDIRFLVRTLLEGQGYDVETAEDGFQALERVDAREPELIVLDLMMPGMDGWTVLSRVRERERPPRVVLLSAYASDPKVQERGREEGAWACIAKPFRLPELLTACSRALDS